MSSSSKEKMAGKETGGQGFGTTGPGQSLQTYGFRFGLRYRQVGSDFWNVGNVGVGPESADGCPFILGLLLAQT